MNFWLQCWSVLHIRSFYYCCNGNTYKPFLKYDSTIKKREELQKSQIVLLFLANSIPYPYTPDFQYLKLGV